jgi:hypothetical protein
LFGFLEMSSRKSGSRASSRRSSASKASANGDLKAEIYTNDNAGNKKIHNISQNILITAFIISVIVQGSILYYLYNLEDADCSCIRDWRHNFCKGYALLALGLGIILITFGHLHRGINILYHIATLVNVYAFFTYIGDLNATKCNCAVNKQSNLNSVMRVYRWLLLLVGISAFMQLLALLGIGATTMPSS